MEYVLKTDQLCKHYRKSRALDGATLSVPKGAVYGLVGRNGAGKTTLMRVVCGLQEPSDGSYELFGIERKNRDMIKSRRRIGAIIEKPALYPDLSAKKNMQMQYSLLGIPSDDGIDELLSLVGLSDTGKKKARSFSLGMRQRLGIALALCGGPDLLFLDEPINGLDPQGIVEIRELILKLNREKGVTIVISSHILSELSLLATHYGFMDKGRIVREISAEELERQARKSIAVKISDGKAFARTMERLGFEYEMTGDNDARIYASVSVGKLASELSSEGCELISANEADESLESYFIDLVGGGENA